MRLSMRRSRLVVEQDAPRRAVEILELAGIERPKKGNESAEAERERDGNEEKEAAHVRLRAKRKALPMTMSEELDIASAASKGVTSPIIARGTASPL